MPWHDHKNPQNWWLFLILSVNLKNLYVFTGGLDVQTYTNWYQTLWTDNWSIEKDFYQQRLRQTLRRTMSITMEWLTNINENDNKQSCIHNNPCCRPLGRGSNEYGMSFAQKCPRSQVWRTDVRIDTVTYRSRRSLWQKTPVFDLESYLRQVDTMPHKTGLIHPPKQWISRDSHGSLQMLSR